MLNSEAEAEGPIVMNTLILNKKMFGISICGYLFVKTFRYIIGHNDKKN